MPCESETTNVYFVLNHAPSVLCPHINPSEATSTAIAPRNTIATQVYTKNTKLDSDRAQTDFRPVHNGGARVDPDLGPTANGPYQ